MSKNMIVLKTDRILLNIRKREMKKRKDYVIEKD